MEYKQVFWITNFSDRNVSLSDLGITIPAGKTVNLLDTKHYSFTLSILEKSASSGSLFNKKHLVAVRKVPPTSIPLPSATIAVHRIIPSLRSVVKHQEVNFDELKINDEEYASNQSDLADDDTIKYR